MTQSGTSKELNIVNNKKYRILSIDGGGIRGIVPGRILSHIESLLGKRIGELFDMIAGTSTGGILTCALLFPDQKDPAKPGYSADEVVDLYFEYGSRECTYADIIKTFELAFLRVQNKAHAITRFDYINAVIVNLDVPSDRYTDRVVDAPCTALSFDTDVTPHKRFNFPTNRWECRVKRCYSVKL